MKLVVASSPLDALSLCWLEIIREMFNIEVTRVAQGLGGVLCLVAGLIGNIHDLFF